MLRNVKYFYSGADVPVMDEKAKSRFRWKFYGLAVELDIIILLVAMSVPVFLIVHSAYTIPVIFAMLVIALILSIDFLKKYRATRAWLDDNAKKENDAMQEIDS